jgi:hypothetical protein
LTHDLFRRIRARYEPTPVRAGIVLAVAVGGALAYASVLGHGQPRTDWRGLPLGDWLFWRIAALWAWAIFLSAACVSTGYALLTRAFRIAPLPTLETLVHSAAVGLVVFVEGMYLIGFAGLFKPAAAFLLPAVMLAAGGRPTLAFLRERVEGWTRRHAGAREPVTRAAAFVAIAFGVCGTVLVYLGALTPDSINFDASWSHLPIAVDYARAGRIIAFDGDYTRNFPHLASLVHTWAMIVPSWGILVEAPLRWMLALHLEFTVFLWTLAGVAAMASWLTSTPRLRGAWAAFFLFPAIFVYDSNLGGAADHYVAFFAAPLFLAVVRAAPRFEWRACALVGIYAGGALLTKYQAVYLIAGAGLVFAIEWIATNRRRLGWGPAAAVAAFALVVAPHFAKNWVFYRNPLYPFAQDVFESRPTTPNAAFLFKHLFQDTRWQPHGTFATKVAEAIRLCFSWSFGAHYSFTHDLPIGGALFTLCVPMALAIREPRRVWLGYASGFGALFAWAMIFRVDRHLQTFMPLLVATTAAVIVRAWELGGLARVGLAILVGLQVIWGGDAPFDEGYSRIESAMKLIRSGYEGHARDRFARFFADRRAMTASLPPNARVLLHMIRPNLGIDRDAILDWPGQQGLFLYEGIHGPRDLYDHWRAIGVTHLLWQPGFRASISQQEEVLFSDFVHRFVKVQMYGNQALAALPETPPPPDHPYRVLALGLHGYADGVYAVEAMKTYEGVAYLPEEFPAPDVSLPEDPAAQADLESGVDAICVGKDVKPSVALQARISAWFELAAAYSGNFSVFVRR